MSYEHYDRFTVATTCLFLASKVEETPKKLKDVVIETYKVHHAVDKAREADTKVGLSTARLWGIGVASRRGLLSSACSPVLPVPHRIRCRNSLS